MGKLSRGKKERRLVANIGGKVIKNVSGMEARREMILSTAAGVAMRLDGDRPGIQVARWAVGYQEQTIRGNQEAAKQGLPVLNPGPVDCKRGCHYCCHMPVEVSVPEILLLADFVRTGPPEHVAAFRQHLVEYIAVTEGMDAVIRTQTNVPCVFLNLDGECMAYQARPLACRMFASADVNACRKSFQGFKEWNLFREKVRTILGDPIIKGLHLALARAGIDDEAIELARGLKIALDHPDAEERWRRGEPIFAPAHACTVHPRPFPEKKVVDQLRDAGILDG